MQQKKKICGALMMVKDVISVNLDILKKAEDLPFVITAAFELLYNIFIHEIKLGPDPKEGYNKNASLYSIKCLFLHSGTWRLGDAQNCSDVQDVTSFSCYQLRTCP